MSQQSGTSREHSRRFKESKMYGPQVVESDLVHKHKYRGEGENFRECANRISSALQDDHDHYMAFREILMSMRFLPPGRVQSAMGSLKNITPYNCFVMPTIHDSFTDGPTRDEISQLPPGTYPSESIMDVAKKAAITMREGGGVGYDFSTLRPKGDLIRGVMSTTDGPLAFASIYDSICGATSSAGNRRGAQMMVLRCDHPDVETFIRAKQAALDVPYEYRPLRGFNMSIAVTDELMECKESGRPFKLRFGGKVYREVDPNALWEMIMRGTYDWAEPGVLFIDRINEMNNLYYCETIAATNPCGEQPLPPYGACLLGSINLVKYLVPNGKDGWTFDFDQLAADIPHIHRATDNVIDRARYPLPQQRLEAQRKRRMGLGVTGLANCLEALGLPYGTPEFVEFEDELLSFFTRECYRASALLAKEKGSFPLYDEDRYLTGRFVSGLDAETIDLIKRYGIRNSHLTSLAPTGTISFCADNVSSGIEPVFSYSQQRRINMPEGAKIVSVEDYGVNFLNVRGRRATEVMPRRHVAVLCTAQMHVDSAVSKTCNVPTSYSYDDFKDLYQLAFEGGAKGCTTYRSNGNYDDVIRSADVAEEPASPEACGWDPETGQRTGACAD